jgi:hypothetical protein
MMAVTSRISFVSCLVTLVIGHRAWDLILLCRTPSTLCMLIAIVAYPNLRDLVVDDYCVPLTLWDMFDYVRN